uniref:Uncharacterized protein n=1 Tax=Papilio xuthus TaxID=66420 RepID=I4DQH3_PAPXU|nr:unknown unsecreted protein [Papilio xuthus]
MDIHNVRRTADTLPFKEMVCLLFEGAKVLLVWKYRRRQTVPQRGCARQEIVRVSHRCGMASRNFIYRSGNRQHNICCTNRPARLTKYHDHSDRRQVEAFPSTVRVFVFLLFSFFCYKARNRKWICRCRTRVGR